MAYPLSARQRKKWLAPRLVLGGFISMVPFRSPSVSAGPGLFSRCRNDNAFPNSLINQLLQFSYFLYSAACSPHSHRYVLSGIPTQPPNSADPPSTQNFVCLDYPRVFANNPRRRSILWPSRSDSTTSRK